jgi:hypothetical protein
MNYSSYYKESNRPEKRLFKGHDFELIFTSNGRNKAKREAKKCRKHGFFTRVVETDPSLFSVYRRPKRIE